MKKKTILALGALALACVLLVTACPKELEEIGPTAPTWLVGKWSNAGATFTIASNYTFTCDLVSLNPQAPTPGRVRGSIDYKTLGLAPNNFIMKNMQAGGPTDPDASYADGNTTLAAMLPGFQDLLVKLEPNAAKTQFTFSGQDNRAPAANDFFGAAGPYTKQP